MNKNLKSQSFACILISKFAFRMFEQKSACTKVYMTNDITHKQVFQPKTILEIIFSEI
jgi:hypothetical protein